MLTTLSGLALSRFCFGTMQFGGGSDLETSRAIYDLCRSHNINHFDTAHAYTGGLSEEWLGAFLKNERDHIFVSSKLGYTGGADPVNLTAQLEKSRTRLNQDVIDLLYLHRFDQNTPIEKTLGWFLDQMRHQRIRYVGLSNFAAWQITQACFLGQQHGLKISAVQPMYSLVKRQAEVEIFPACAEFGIDCFSYSPLGAGLLTGKYSSANGEGRLASDARYAKRYGSPEMHTCANALNEIAKRYDIPAATLAVAWILKSRYRPTPIISAKTCEQMTPVLKALDFELSEQLESEIDAISPKPTPATDRLEEQE